MFAESFISCCYCVPRMFYKSRVSVTGRHDAYTKQQGSLSTPNRGQAESQAFQRRKCTAENACSCICNTFVGITDAPAPRPPPSAPRSLCGATLILIRRFFPSSAKTRFGSPRSRATTEGEQAFRSQSQLAFGTREPPFPPVCSGVCYSRSFNKVLMRIFVFCFALRKTRLTSENTPVGLVSGFVALNCKALQTIAVHQGCLFGRRW